MLIEKNTDMCLEKKQSVCYQIN